MAIHTYLTAEVQFTVIDNAVLVAGLLDGEASAQEFVDALVRGDILIDGVGRVESHGTNEVP